MFLGYPAGSEDDEEGETLSEKAPSSAGEGTLLEGAEENASQEVVKKKS